MNEESQLDGAYNRRRSAGNDWRRKSSYAHSNKETTTASAPPRRVSALLNLCVRRAISKLSCIVLYCIKGNGLELRGPLLRTVIEGKSGRKENKRRSKTDDAGLDDDSWKWKVERGGPTARRVAMSYM